MPELKNYFANSGTIRAFSRIIERHGDRPALPPGTRRPTTFCARKESEIRNEVPNHLNDGHHFSDSSRDVIQDIEAFLRSHSPSEYTCTNAAAVLNRALKSD